jgi:alpha-tubulin suppressor-like RCC1 family protein
MSLVGQLQAKTEWGGQRVKTRRSCWTSLILGLALLGGLPGSTFAGAAPSIGLYQSDNATLVSNMAVSVTAGQEHTCAVLTDGTVRCWGWIGYGQTGMAYGSIPGVANDISTATAISAGDFHTCALLAGGTVSCWGWNIAGELGTGTISASSTPVAVSGISTATAISVGASQTCAVLVGDGVSCWGDSEYGQLGNGRRISSSTPVVVSGISAATAISAGGDHACAVLTGGGVRCWGGNAFGDLGDGTFAVSAVPVSVLGFGAPAKTFKVAIATNPTAAGVAHSVTVSALDAYGNVTLGYSGTVHFTSSDARAVLPADYTFIIEDKGVHRLTTSLTLKTAGSRSVTVTDVSDSLIQGTQSGIVVTPGSMKTYKVAVANNPTVAGVAHSVTVTAQDAYGNTVTSYVGTIHFTSSDARSVLPADYTFAAADRGSHKFTGALTLKTAGARTVKVTDTATPTIYGLETVTVSSGTAKTLRVSIAASPYPVGRAHSVTVTALDAYGNAATGYVGTIHFTSSDGAAALPGDYTFTGADNGKHKFTTALTLKATGSQSVTVTDVGHSSITGSQTVTVE